MSENWRQLCPGTDHENSCQKIDGSCTVARDRENVCQNIDDSSALALDRKNVCQKINGSCALAMTFLKLFKAIVLKNQILLIMISGKKNKTILNLKVIL